MTEHVIDVNNQKNHIRINKPEHDDTAINISLNDFNDITLSIDYYHETPVLYVYSPTNNAPEHAIALPTTEHPKPHLLDTETPISTQLNPE